ncbi:hypothetical protein FRB97_003459 [Tulasnella sp. 331]|nr:hypothetical protein FRB97_003459 [Tulasnella sp. 331]
MLSQSGVAKGRVNSSDPSLKVTQLACLLEPALTLETLTGSVAIQYILALDLAGYIDGPTSSKISTIDRYHRLQHHEQAWRDVAWRQHNEYTIDHRSSTYELYGGVYAQGLESRDADSGAHPITRGMELIEFPSLLRNQPEGHTWTIPDLGVDTKDFGMDPDKNLLVLMEHVPARQVETNLQPADNPPLSVHLLNLRDENATPHSLAQHPILSYQPRIYKSMYSYWVQVVGDMLAVLFRPGPDILGQIAVPLPAADELILWNWKTGDRIASIRFEGTAARSFNFIANDTILVPITLSGTRPVLCLYRLEGTPGSIEPVMIAQYSLPTVTEDVNMTAREGVGGKKNGDEKIVEPVWPEHGPPPFTPLPSNRIIVLSLWMVVSIPGLTRTGQVTTWEESRNYTVFVKADTLLEFWKAVDPPKPTDTQEQRQEGGDYGVRSETFVKVPWEVWGSKNTRFLVESTEANCVCYVYGLRYCRLVLSPEDTVQLRVMDFNSVDFIKVLEADAEAHATTSIPSDGTEPGLFFGTDHSSVDSELPTEQADADADQDQDQEFNEEDFLPHLPAILGAYHLDDVEIDDGDEAWIDAGGDGGEGENEDDAEDGQDIWHNTDDSVAGFGILRTGSVATKEQFERTKIAIGPTYVMDRAVFTERIETELPFRWSFKDAPEVRRFSKVMIDNEHIIGLRPANAGSTGRLALDVLTL